MLSDHSLFGFSVVLSDTVTVRTEVRIKGGYENRWLIRAFEDRPGFRFVGDRIEMHPEFYRQLRHQVHKKWPTYRGETI